MKSELKDALSVLERKAIAPLKRVMATRPKGFVHTNYAAWTARLAEVEADAAKQLAAIGADVAWGKGHGTIQLLGIRARSARSLLGALENWRKQAIARSSKENRNVRSA